MRKKQTDDVQQVQGCVFQRELEPLQLSCKMKRCFGLSEYSPGLQVLQGVFCLYEGTTRGNVWKIKPEKL